MDADAKLYRNPLHIWIFSLWNRPNDNFGIYLIGLFDAMMSLRLLYSHTCTQVLQS